MSKTKKKRKNPEKTEKEIVISKKKEIHEKKQKQKKAKTKNKKIIFRKVTIMSLDDLIVRSRDLNSDLNSVSVAPNAASQSNTNDVAPMIHTLPRIDRDLTQVMEAGRRLWEQLGRPTEFSESDKVKAALVLNKTDTNFTLPSDNPKFQKLLKNTDLAPLEPCRDLDQLLSNERENAILALIENSEQAADSLAFETTTATILSKWNTEKTQLMQYFKGVNSGGDSWRDTAKNESRVFNQQNSFFNNTSISNLSMKEAMRSVEKVVLGLGLKKR